MNERQITPSLFATGVADTTLDLFEGQYRVPNGITYNSYYLSDEKTVLFDTADRRVAAEWLAGVEQTAGGRGIDYLVVSHMEPDHSAAIRLLADRYPAMRIVGNAKTFQMMRAFFGRDFGDRAVVVGEGDALETGAHTIRFYMAPMVHWPEVMVSFDERDGVLFSADAFGRFGLPGDAGDWADEARRYYINIVGKYG
ncbi:MAG: FprA family A-type flavoprotein, partial [Candidatus Woodwardiibium sp.]